MLLAGVGRTTLTPPLGTPLIGYGGRERGADAIRDDIYATSLVLSDGATTVVFVTCDLCALPIQQVRYVQQRIEERTGIPPEHILVNTSHAHSGPLTTFNEETPAGLRRIVLDLLDGIAESVVQAAAKRVPCQVAAGKGAVRASINRRKRNGYSDAVTRESPEGTVDPDLHVVRIDGLDGMPIAAVTAYACHPVALRPPSHAYSADFVYALRERVEPQIGAPMLFAQGAAGNLVPIGPEMEMEERLDLTGRMLGEEALRVHTALSQTNRQAQGMPNEEDKQSRAAAGKESRAREEALGAISRTEESARETAGAAPTSQSPLLAAASETLLLDLWMDQPPIGESGHSHQTFPYLTPPLVEGKVECAVQALRIGDAALVGVAGEAFVEIGLAVKERSTIPHTIFLGYTNGCLGYIPTVAAYPAGGYEVHRAHTVYRLPHTIAPNSADKIIKASLGLLAAL